MLLVFYDVTDSRLRQCVCYILLVLIGCYIRLDAKKPGVYSMTWCSTAVLQLHRPVNEGYLSPITNLS